MNTVKTLRFLRTVPAPERSILIRSVWSIWWYFEKRFTGFERIGELSRKPSKAKMFDMRDGFS